MNELHPILSIILKESLLLTGTTTMITNIFLFGSALYSLSPSDIDLLTIYRNSHTSNYRNLMQLRECVRVKVKRDLGKEVDMVILNEDEYHDSVYESLEKVVLIA